MTRLHTLKLGMPTVGTGTRRAPDAAAPDRTHATEITAESAQHATGPRKPRARTSASVLLGLGAISTVVTLAAVVASGAVRGSALRDLVAGAAVAGAAVMLSGCALAVSPPPSPAVAGPAPRTHGSSRTNAV